MYIEVFLGKNRRSINKIYKKRNSCCFFFCCCRCRLVLIILCKFFPSPMSFSWLNVFTPQSISERMKNIQLCLSLSLALSFTELLRVGGRGWLVGFFLLLFFSCFGFSLLFLVFFFVCFHPLLR